MSPTAFIKHTVIGLTALTAVGLLVHDTKLDEATSVALALPVAFMGFEIGAASVPHLSNEGHTHVERVSLSNALRDLHAGTPRIQPRDTHKKYVLQKRVVKGVHTFDGYYLPVASL